MLVAVLYPVRWYLCGYCTISACVSICVCVLIPCTCVCVLYVRVCTVTPVPQGVVVTLSPAAVRSQLSHPPHALHPPAAMAVQSPSPSPLPDRTGVGVGCWTATPSTHPAYLCSTPPTVCAR
uniref:Uncharacterized protein n=1 Tax=Lygus hesperus TaxID=30085 RepID=A0A146LQ16_LYGHE